MKKAISLAAALGGVILAASVHAQILTNPVQDYINKTTLLNNILSNRRAIEMSQKAMSKKGNRGSKTSAKTQKPVAAASSTTFKFSPQPMLPQLLTASGSLKDTAGARQFFASQVKLYRDTAHSDGLPANDLAYAFEYFVVNNYLTARDLHTLPPDKDPYIQRGSDSFDRISLAAKKKVEQVTPYQERAIYGQFKTLLSNNPEVRKMTDGKKQELTELLAIMLGVNLVQYMKGIQTGNDSVAEEARQSARQSLERLLGVPVERLKISAYGLQW